MTTALHENEAGRCIDCGGQTAAGRERCKRHAAPDARPVTPPATAVRHKPDCRVPRMVTEAGRWEQLARCRTCSRFAPWPPASAMPVAEKPAETGLSIRARVCPDCLTRAARDQRPATQDGRCHLCWDRAHKSRKARPTTTTDPDHRQDG